VATTRTRQVQVQGRRRRLERGDLSALAPEKAREALLTEERQLDLLARLVEDMLDISRMARTGTIEIRSVEVDLCQIVGDVVDRFREEARGQGIELRPENCEKLPVVVDSYRLDPGVSNLVKNALRYGIDRPVEVRVEEEEGRARILVRDEGVDIAPEDQARIFEHFKRASGRKDGLGLGLYIVREIVERHGGLDPGRERPRPGLDLHGRSSRQGGFLIGSAPHDQAL
jgi:signal transduction histidine kinase